MKPEDHAMLQPLTIYLRDLDAALTAGLEYPALALTLALPEICSTLEKEGGRASKDLYAKWCDRWVTTSQKRADSDPGKFLTGAELYDLRCAFLHNGSDNLSKPNGLPPRVLQRYEIRRRELSPGGGKVSVRDWSTGTLKVYAASICADVVRGVRQWSTAVSANEIVIQNLGTLLDLDRSPAPK